MAGLDDDDGDPPSALFRDPPPHPTHPAETAASAIPSGNFNLNALLYTAAGPGPHPTILLLHGLPGNEQNIDLAQATRRAGWNVLTLHYRGSWGTPGSFSFAHCIADAAAALDWLAIAGANSRIDPSRLVLIGHSMGGYIAAHIAAGRSDLLGTALISPANIGIEFGLPPRREAVGAVDDNIGTSEGLHILARTSPEALAREARDNAAIWRLERHAAGLAVKPVLLVTSDDGFAEGSSALAQALRETGRLTGAHFSTDHSYSDSRLGLQAAVLRWLAGLGAADR